MKRIMAEERVDLSSPEARITSFEEACKDLPEGWFLIQIDDDLLVRGRTIATLDEESIMELECDFDPDGPWGYLHELTEEQACAWINGLKQRIRYAVEEQLGEHRRIGDQDVYEFQSSSWVELPED